MSQCEAKKIDGSQCKRKASIDSRYCHAHDPVQKSKFLEGRKKARKWDKHLDPSSVGPPPETIQELIQITGESIQDVRTNQLDPNRAKVIAQLVKVQKDLIDARSQLPDSELDEISKMSDEELRNAIMKLSAGIEPDVKSGNN